jgi:LmbE family N-acetylglucosaminyl deacetylase
LLHLDLKGEPPVPLTVLCLGAHADDIEVGCGGTVLEITARRPGSLFHWVVLCARGQRRKEASASAEFFLKQAGTRSLTFEDFRDGFLPYEGARVKEFFERIKGEVQPDLVLTHCRGDLHQDHRLVNELTWNTFRDHLILEYEIPKYDGDLGQPNVFVPISRASAAAKAEGIVEHFASQQGKHWFGEETFLALLRLRGIEARAPSGYAEAFYGRKIPLSFGKGEK